MSAKLTIEGVEFSPSTEEILDRVRAALTAMGLTPLTTEPTQDKIKAAISHYRARYEFFADGSVKYIPGQ